MYRIAALLLLLCSSAVWAQTAPQTTNRDIHRNPFAPPTTSIYTHPTVTTPTSTATHTSTVVTRRDVVPPPSFSVAGIFSYGGTTGALVGGTHPRTVVVGDSVGIYRVTAIDAGARFVTVSARNKTFRVRLAGQ